MKGMVEEGFSVGEAIGASVYGAVYEGAKAWSREVGKGQSI